MPYHTLFAQQFDRDLLERLCALSNRIRFINKSKEGALYLKSVLAHKRAMLYFSQPSSRTFLSHLAACQLLGITTGSVRDAATSSEFKGESREDSIRTFSSYFDMIIMRSPEQGLAEKMAWELSNSSRPVPILNAGSGKDQHRTFYGRSRLCLFRIQSGKNFFGCHRVPVSFLFTVFCTA